MKTVFAAFVALALVGCQQSADAPADAPAEAPAAEATAEAATAAPSLADILDAQSEEVKARYQHRNPQETIEFVGIEPGMTVVEGLPGGGWYTQILLPYVGAEGRLIGADYSLEMYPNFSFVTDEFMENQKNWTTNFVAGAGEYTDGYELSVGAFHFGSMPEEFVGTADAVFFPRVLHNLARFEPDGGYLTAALGDAYAVLKPGGVFGVVQHEAREDMSDEFANGSNGYLKKAFVIAAAEAAGFEFVAESDINQNPADQPTEEDFVWRLSPTLGTSRDNPELRAEIEAIGESNRMTLKFRKPE